MATFGDIKIGDFFTTDVFDGDIWYGVKVNPVEGVDCDGFSMQRNAILFNKKDGQSFLEALNPMRPVTPIDKIECSYSF